MRVRLMGWTALLLGLSAAPLRAQNVEAGVVVQSGPVSGHVEVGSPPPVVVQEQPARVIVVEHIRVVHDDDDWWKEKGYRRITLYWDGDTYYTRRFEGGRPLRAVVVYERGGRYYEWSERHEHHDHGHGHAYGRKHHDGDDDD
jgi:hypothetical protein